MCCLVLEPITEPQGIQTRFPLEASRCLGAPQLKLMFRRALRQCKEPTSLKTGVRHFELFLLVCAVCFGRHTSQTVFHGKTRSSNGLKQCVMRSSPHVHVMSLYFHDCRVQEGISSMNKYCRNKLKRIAFVNFVAARWEIRPSI